MKIFIPLLLLPLLLSSSPKKEVLYKKVFPNFAKKIEHKIDDPIGEFKTNIKLYEASDKNGKRLGFMREVSTSTGCNDGCLPVIFTLFYSKEGKFLRVLSRVGLTKKDHEEFSELDYLQLESILRRNPKAFKKVGHPTEMVDAISRATLKVYKPHVIEKAAYTTLRVNLYNQHSLKFIAENLLKPMSK